MKKEQHDLVKRIRNGDKDAFGLLVVDLLPSAYKTAYLILRSKEHAEDALQNVLEGAYLSIMKNKEMTNFKAWFFRLVYSRSIDVYRKNNRHVEMDIVDNTEVNRMMKTESVQNVVIRNENKSEMIAFIMTLKKEQSVPIFLHYYEELTVKEISLVLHENINTVKTRLTRGRKKLAQLLNEKKEFSEEAKANG
ncbi:MAG: RNA polymerase sigma factor [Peribacillus sp.]